MKFERDFYVYLKALVHVRSQGLEDKFEGFRVIMRWIVHEFLSSSGQLHGRKSSSTCLSDQYFIFHEVEAGWRVHVDIKLIAVQRHLLCHLRVSRYVWCKCRAN
jgi:hypothetical protein